MSTNQTPLASRDPNIAPALPRDNVCTVLRKETEVPMASAECHRQLLKSAIADDSSSALYISPSDSIMSPCTAKLTALRSKNQEKVKPRSLFAQSSSRKLAASMVKGSGQTGIAMP